MLKFIILFTALSLVACNSRPQPSTEQPDAAGTDSQPADTVTALTINLMDYATVDTCDGEFEGYYDEKVADYNLTVSATVRVRVDNCRVTAITIVDSSNVHPAAARLIPQRIIESQSLPVEAVSGASVASWTLMTATAVALGIDLTELEDITGKTQ